MHKEDASKPKKKPHHIGHKKVFDVTRPGKSMAPSNSRSVITGHKPPVPDDQFVPGAPKLLASDPDEKHELLNSKHKKDLSPLAGETSNENAAEAVITAPVVPLATVGDAVDAHAVGTSESDAASAPLLSNATKADSPVTLPEEELAAASAPERVTSSDTTPPALTPELNPEETETPAHLIMEQTVRTEDLPIWENPETSQQNSQASPRAGAATTGLSGATSHGKTIEDLLAETGAPILEPDKQPALIVSHHHKHVPVWERLLIFLFVLLLAAITLNVLLDAEIIRTSLGLPYTDLL